MNYLLNSHPGLDNIELHWQFNDGISKEGCQGRGSGPIIVTNPHFPPCCLPSLFMK